MSTKRLNLKKLSVEDFGGIDKSKPIVIDISNSNAAIISGDQGTGKTSTVNALLYALGQKLPSKEENFYNTTDGGKLSVDLDFDFEGEQYKVHATKSRFSLQKLVDVNGKEAWLNVPEPIEMLTTLVGYVGISPMDLKGKKGAEQVKEIRKALAVAADIEAEETNKKKLLAEATEKRRTAWREYEIAKKKLSDEPMYENWEQSEETYKEIKTVDSVKKEFEAAEEKKSKFDKAVTGKEELIKQFVLSEERINELKAQLAEAEQMHLNLGKRIDEGSKWIEANKSTPDEYGAAKQAYFDVQGYIDQKKKWESIKQLKKDMDEFETLVQQFDTRKDEIKQELLELGKKGLPDIEGLEVVASDSIEGKDVGVYLNGKNLAQLSESELWGLFLKIWSTQGVNIVVIENLTSLGSKAIEILNDLAEQGVKIFGTEMRRGQDSIEVTLTDKIK